MPEFILSKGQPGFLGHLSHEPVATLRAHRLDTVDTRKPTYAPASFSGLTGSC